MSYSSCGGGLNLVRLLFQTVSGLKRYVCSQCVEMEHTFAEKRRNLLRYTPKPHSHALNDVIMHKTHCFICCCFWFISIFSVQSTKTIPIIAPPTHVFLAFSYSTLRVQFGIDHEVYGYNVAEAESLKINIISHSNFGLCVIFRL